MTSRATSPTACNSRMMNAGKYPSFVSPIRPGTHIDIEPGQNDRGTYSYFVRIWTAGVVTYEEDWTSDNRARERFERVVENHLNGVAPGL